MTNKAKLIYADYMLEFVKPGNLRFVEMWKPQAIRRFLESGTPLNKKGVEAYVSALPPAGTASPAEIESLLLGLISATKAKRTSDTHSDNNLPSKEQGPGLLNAEKQQSLADFQLWMAKQRELSPNTIRSYAHSVKLYLQQYSSLNQKDVVAYKQALLAGGAARQTILRMNSIANYAKFLGKKIEIKRARIIRTLECNNVPSESEMTVFLAKADIINHYWYLVARCLSTTGVRVHELLKITYRDILNGNVVLIGKGEKPRRIFFQAKFIDEIKDYLKGRTLILDERFCPKTTRGVAQIIRSYAGKAGLDVTKFHPHAFRHYFAKQYLKNNPNDIVGLQGLLGHSSIETTSIYLRRSYEEQMNDFRNNVTWE